MTEQELLSALEGKYWKVGVPKDGQVVNGVQLRLVNVLDKVGNNVSENMISYWKDGIDCYWRHAEPKLLNFANQVKAYIAEKKSAGIIEEGFIEIMDSSVESAIVKVITNDVKELRFFIDRDGEGDIRHRQITV